MDRQVRGAGHTDVPVRGAWVMGCAGRAGRGEAWRKPQPSLSSRTGARPPGPCSEPSADAPGPWLHLGPLTAVTTGPERVQAMLQGTQQWGRASTEPLPWPQRQPALLTGPALQEPKRLSLHETHPGRARTKPWALNQAQFQAASESHRSGGGGWRARGPRRGGPVTGHWQQLRTTSSLSSSASSEFPLRLWHGGPGAPPGSRAGGVVPGGAVGGGHCGVVTGRPR